MLGAVLIGATRFRVGGYRMQARIQAAHRDGCY
jgi:hypothetical protein